MCREFEDWWARGGSAHAFVEARAGDPRIAFAADRRLEAAQRMPTVPLKVLA